MNRRSWCLLLCALGAALLPASAAIVSPGRRAAVFLVGAATRTPIERAVTERLEGLGYSVLVTSAGRLKPLELRRASLVLVSSSAAAQHSVVSGLREASLPLVVWNPGYFAALGLTGPIDGVDSGTAAETALVVTRPEHPLAAGLAGRVAVASMADLPWGLPASDAIVAASLSGDASKVAVFAYEEGTRMFDRPAPGRRVGLFLPADGAVEPAGWRLFESAVRWAATRNRAPRASARDAEVRAGEAPPFRLDATLHGDVVDPASTRRGIDVKAITLHELRAEREGAGWHGHFVADL